jgi:2-polyprenyl-3-methyl-5-hydroxy-6-metoxy-1,4-benzoquinol methylase
VIAASPKYSETFFDETQLTSMRSAQVVVPLVLRLTNAKSVVDLGCGTGAWLAEFQRCSAEKICGVDNASLENAQLQVDRSCIIKHDLTKAFALDESFDLSMCLEVAEHLPASCAPQVVENLTKLAGMVLFAAAIPHQGGTGHINEQWPEYWAQMFSARGYRAIDCFRDTIWQDENVAYWYAQNLLLYVREDVLRLRPDLNELAKRTNASQLARVHPKTYIKNQRAATSPKMMLMRFAWNSLPRFIRVRLVKPLGELIWKHVSTEF